MSDTNTQNNSALISLSRAAQLTGYHQDYLGQLCRLGKLSAIKVGRNWFTFPEALNKLSVTIPDAEKMNFVESVEETLEDQEQTPEAAFEFEQPKIVQNVTISQVEGLPIAIRTLPMTGRNINTVQNMLTNLRIESLQREVSDLRKLLARIITEVASHSAMLERGASSRTDQLRHSYISNFDFSSPYSRRNLITEGELPAPLVEKINWAPPHQPKYSLVAVFAGVAVLAALALMSFGIISGQFFGDLQPQVSTIYHRDTVIASEPYTVLRPAVAGDTLPPESIGNPE